MKNIKINIIVVLGVFVFGAFAVNAQSLESPSYRLVEPTVDTVSGTSDSTSYSMLSNSGPVGSYTMTSTSYTSTGGTAKFIEANVPEIICFETDTNSGTTNCSGVPGGDGMQGVCSEPGCYDRAKLEIDAQANPVDTRYAIQISTTSDFSSDVNYVDGTTRMLTPTLDISDFLFKCEWEGTVQAGYCASGNTTYQKFNILGLIPNETYYARVSAYQGSDSDAGFSQSAWGPSVGTTTELPSITYDIDIATTTGGSSNAPYNIDLGNLNTGSVTTASDYIIFRITSNSLSGSEVSIRGQNGGLEYSANLIAAVNNDLDSISEGFGLRNDSTTNSAQNTANLGSIVVSTSPSDFSDTGASEKVGAPTTSLVQLFNSNSLPIDTGVSAYWVKAKAAVTTAAGSYSEILSTYASASY